MQESNSWRKELPMWITFSRVALIPFLIVLLIGNGPWYKWGAAILFALASLTDYYDGYFARKYNAISNMGKFMDPVADKILVSSVFVMLLYLNKIDPYMVMLILARDTYIGGLRAIAAADQFVIDAKPAGKWKTAMQMSAIPFLILGDVGSIPFTKWSYAILWLSVVLILTSGCEYYLAYKTDRKKY
jgi:CDP-diacylglycerol--glycerol-3-phosphate 3-phosphatidyltransferase